MEAKDWITLIASLGALIFSVLNFRRNRSLENQNHLFKSKIEIYSKIFTELNHLINKLQNHLIQTKQLLANPSQDTKDALYKKADKIDKLCFQFDDLIISNSLLIPKNILEELNNLSTKILNNDPADDESQSLNHEINRAENFLNQLITEANRIGVLLRKDIRTDELNTDLYKRLGRSI